MTRHIHVTFGTFELASRAWREGRTAIEHGYATEAVFVGYKKAGLPDTEEIGQGQTIHRIGDEPPGPGAPKLKRALALPRWWRAMNTEISADGASLVIAHSLATLPGAVRFARRNGLPVLYDAHELETERNGWPLWLRWMAQMVEKRLIRKCGHTIVVNDSIRDWYREAYPGISINTVRNVPVIPDVIGDSTLRADLGIDQDALVFVYCGNLAPGRGLPELIEVFRDFDQTRQLVVIGSGLMAEDLRRQSEGIGNIHICDPMPQPSLLAFISGADVGVAVASGASLSYRYGLSNKVFEYAASGLALCTSPGPEFERLAATYPLARNSPLTTEDLTRVLSQFTRAELDAAQPHFKSFEPPSWEAEHKHLLAAFDIALGRKSDFHA